MRDRGHSQTYGWAGLEITRYQVRDCEVRRGVALLSCDLWALDFSAYLGEYASVLMCVLSVGIHPCAAYCVEGCVDGMDGGVKEEDQ